MGGTVDGVGTNALMNYPACLTVDTIGNLYVVDDSRIRKITSAGFVLLLS